VTAGTDPEAQPDPRRWPALAVCLVAGFMTLLDVSIVNVALPSIRASLHATQSDLQWILSGYALAFGLLLVPAGRFGDARGRRGVFVAGLAIFTLASAVAGFATGAGFLVIARLVQGAAGGIIIPQVTGLIQVLFRGAERGRAYGLLGSIIGISTAIGPLLGGGLIALAGEQQGWRWVFWVNIPIGAVAILLALRLIPQRPSEQRRRESLDPVGVALLGVGVVLLLLPLVQEQQWPGRAKWLLTVAAVGVLAGFVGWERWYGRRSQPVADLSLFRVRSYALGSLVGLLYFAGFTSIFFVFTLYLQNGLHYSALLAGLATMPFALGSAVAAVLGGRVVTRVGRPLVAAGLAAVAVGLSGVVIVVGLVPGHRVALATALPLLVAGLGSGLAISPNQTLTLSEVPARRAGSAGGVLQTGQRIGAALGIAGVGSVFFARLAGARGDWGRALQDSLLVAIGFVVAAFVAAMVDVAAGRRADRRDPARAAGHPGAEHSSADLDGRAGTRG
jgi:EmrB/QacA subfamily drug resistance transporter